MLQISNYKYIFEFDLKQFFPSVDTRGISQILRILEVPNDFVRYLELLNMSQPILPEDKDTTREGPPRRPLNMRVSLRARMEQGLTLRCGQSRSA